MLLIGSHVSFAKEKQLLGCVLETLKYGANTFMFYTGAPQNTIRIKIDDKLTKDAWQLMKENGIDISNIIVHAPYIINIANRKDKLKFEFAVDFLIQELNRCQELGIKKMVLHPGSHVGEGKETGIKNITTALNLAIAKSNSNTIICLETMAGKGGEMGSTFNELKMILDGISDKKRVQFCLDTCHLHDAGFDLTKFDELLDDFDKKIGIDKIGCIHINDSKSKKGDKKDRHENFGYGYIGFDTLLSIIYHKKLEHIPKILETPYVTENDTSKERKYPPYKYEIEMIKKKEFDDELITKIRNHYSKSL